MRFLNSKRKSKSFIQSSRGCRKFGLTRWCVFVGRHSPLSKDERRAAVEAMPEYIEHNRLVKLQRPFIDRVHQLIDQMWSTPRPVQLKESGRKCLSCLDTSCATTFGARITRMRIG